MINHHVKIFISIILSFFLVKGITYYSENPEAPAIHASNIRNAVFSLDFSFSGLTDAISFRRLTEQNQNANKTVSNSFNLPSIPGSDPIEEIVEPQSEIPVEKPEVIEEKTKPTPTKKPTPKKSPTPIPTKKPKPTKVPKPTATPKPEPITSDTRPGNSLSEIFDEVGKRACFPPALLMAFQQEETGAFFSAGNPSSVIKIYNTYGWWKTGAGDPCFGLGYHTQTGIVPGDSVGAGTQCRNAVGDPTDIGIMGVLQISEEEETVTRKYTKDILPKNIDRRVLFDNALIFAIATRNRVGSPPRDCNNWPDDMVELAAEKHHGVCNYNYGNGNTGNYCTDILKLYKKYQ